MVGYLFVHQLRKYEDRAVLLASRGKVRGLSAGFTVCYDCITSAHKLLLPCPLHPPIFSRSFQIVSVILNGYIFFGSAVNILREVKKHVLIEVDQTHHDGGGVRRQRRGHGHSQSPLDSHHPEPNDANRLQSSARNKLGPLHIHEEYLNPMAGDIQIAGPLGRQGSGIAEDPVHLARRGEGALRMDWESHSSSHSHPGLLLDPLGRESRGHMGRTSHGTRGVDSGRRVTQPITLTLSEKERLTGRNIYEMTPDEINSHYNRWHASSLESISKSLSPTSSLSSLAEMGMTHLRRRASLGDMEMGPSKSVSYSALGGVEDHSSRMLSTGEGLGSPRWRDAGSEDGGESSNSKPFSRNESEPLESGMGQKEKPRGMLRSSLLTKSTSHLMQVEGGSGGGLGSPSGSVGVGVRVKGERPSVEGTSASSVLEAVWRAQPAYLSHRKKEAYVKVHSPMVGRSRALQPVSGTGVTTVNVGSGGRNGGRSERDHSSQSQSLPSNGSSGSPSPAAVPTSFSAELSNSLPHKTEYLVLDFKGVLGIDTTAARSCFLMLIQLMHSAGVTVVFSDMSVSVERLLTAQCVLGRTDVVKPDLDSALEWCEDRVLLRWV